MSYKRLNDISKFFKNELNQLYKDMDNPIILQGLKIANLSYIIGAIITIIFTYVVNFIMKASLNKIDMIESLKSVE